MSQNLNDKTAGPAANATANQSNSSTAAAFSRAQEAIKQVSACDKPVQNTEWKPK